MNVIEAYNYVMEELNLLKSNGIVIKETPSKSRNSKEIISEYSGENRIPSDKWIHVELQYDSSEDLDQIYESLTRIRNEDIHFDTGGWTGFRDWELDWSFTVCNYEDSNRNS